MVRDPDKIDQEQWEEMRRRMGFEGSEALFNRLITIRIRELQEERKARKRREKEHGNHLSVDQ